MNAITLSDKRVIKIEDIATVTLDDESTCTVLHKEGESWKEEKFFDEDARLIKLMVNEFTVDPKDITPDDIAHINYEGFGSFANFLKWWRSLPKGKS